MKRLLAMLLFLPAACESPFGPPTLIDRPRLLEIRAQPPEIDLNVPSVFFSALIGNPGDEQLSCRWAACLVDIGWVAGNIDCPGEKSLVFGVDCNGAELVTADLLAWYLGQGGKLPDQLPPGVEETDIPLFIGLEIRFDERGLRGLKRLRLNVEGDEPNANPRIADLTMADGSALPRPWLVELGSTLELRPLADESSLQHFFDQEGNSRREDMIFSWFSSAGRFTDRRTIWGADSKGRRLENNSWHIDPQWSRPGPATLWLVARDGRWGSDWLKFQVEIVEPQH